MPSPDKYNPLSLGDVKPILLRVGGALVIALGFLWVTSQVDPGASRATEGDVQTSPNVAGVDSPIFSLGTLEGRDYNVRLISTPAGPRYTVSDLFGTVLATDLGVEELYDRFPQLAVDRMISSPVMMVPTDD